MIHSLVIFWIALLELWFSEQEPCSFGSGLISTLEEGFPNHKLLLQYFYFNCYAELCWRCFLGLGN